MPKAAPKYPPVGSVEVEKESKPGETRTRRNAAHAEKLVEQPLEGIDTVCDVIDYAARTHGAKKALGWRDVVDIHEEEKEIKKTVGGKEVVQKKTWKYFQLSGYKYLSYIEFKDTVTEVAQGLAALGVAKGEIFNVYAQTSVNWQLMSHACALIGTPIATAYDTLGESGLTHSLNEPDCVGVFTNADLLSTLTTVLPNTPTIKLVIYDGEPSASALEALRKTREGLKVLTIQEVRDAGKGKPVDPSRRPSKEDVACIMYTSGTTGAPKGVVITHSNLVASVGAVNELLGHHFQTSDTFLAYLPLAHILEYIVELALYFVGMTIGYGRVKTLTDASVRNCLGDIREFRPSIMVGVPAVWETIRKGIVGKVNSSGTIKKSLFNGGIAVKKAGVPGLKQVVDSVVLSQVRAQTGGRLRLALSGGAAISKETQEFLSLALVTMLSGYGMTESCGMCAILPPEFFQYGSVGLPVPSIDIKLLDVPEAGYRSTNKPPQGEVLIRGPSVIKGYYKRDDLNNDETIFTKDGWLRTGDVGQWNPDGTLTLIDRIKNLIKLQGGEYIALESLESTYKSCNLVANICVHATENAKQPIAIIIPHEANLRHALAAQGSSKLAEASLHDLCENSEVKELVLKSCNAAGKKSNFKQLEMLEAVILTPDEWTPESGLVTAAQKIQRKKIAQAFDKEIKEAYKNSA
ncbi:long-chain-fatty-acid-CoA-ligase [Rickenella mellea]|uniref:Long-chain-fatty-acid-CoA-ligase n=1 Tax=Rickenella mellea TaxID=50990 RepID=A0A4Y7QHD6_9AGAM|nr:long-chain-fatty-acid-CoA-ligase [Rickenella mellea]